MFILFQDIKFLVIKSHLVTVCFISPSSFCISNSEGVTFFPLSFIEGVAIIVKDFVKVYSCDIHTVIKTSNVIFFLNIYFEELTEEIKVFSVELPEIPRKFNIGSNVLVLSFHSIGANNFVSEMNTSELLSLYIIET